MSIFEKASMYTMDDSMKKILSDSGRGRHPPQYKIIGNKIHTTSGNEHLVPDHPMKLYNLIHDIICGVDTPTENNAPSVSTRAATDINDDAIYAYSLRMAKSIDKDDIHAQKIYSCIQTAIYLGHIGPGNISMKRSYITNITGIDINVPRIKYQEAEE